MINIFLKTSKSYCKPPNKDKTCKTLDISSKIHKEKIDL